MSSRSGSLVDASRHAVGRRVGRAHEVLRRVVGGWPFRRGRQRIPAELGKAFARLNASGAIAGVGAGSVVFPYQPGDIGHPGYWFLYEKEVRRLLRGLLVPGSIFIDIGGHRGWHAAYALALVSPGGCVIACEPHPGHAACLRVLAALNPDKPLHVHEVAVTDRTGTVTLFSAQQEGWHTIVPEFMEVCNVARDAVPVAAVTLDDLLAGYAHLMLDRPPRRVVVKIDVEGAEWPVLKGARRTLRLQALRALIVEVTGGPGPWREGARRCITALEEAGWRTAVLADSGTRPWTEDHAGRQVNVLALRGDSP